MRNLLVPDERQYFTYMLRCADGTLYTGWTTDIEDRLKAHNSGSGARYTRARVPVELLASWSFASKSEAMKMEYAIKQLSRREKLELARNAIHAGKRLLIKAMDT